MTGDAAPRDRGPYRRPTARVGRGGPRRLGGRPAPHRDRTAPARSADVSRDVVGQADAGPGRCWRCSASRAACRSSPTTRCSSPRTGTRTSSDIFGDDPASRTRRRSTSASRVRPTPPSRRPVTRTSSCWSRCPADVSIGRGGEDGDGDRRRSRPADRASPAVAVVTGAPIWPTGSSCAARSGPATSPPTCTRGAAARWARAHAAAERVPSRPATVAQGARPALRGRFGACPGSACRCASSGPSSCSSACAATARRPAARARSGAEPARRRVTDAADAPPDPRTVHVFAAAAVHRRDGAVRRWRSRWRSPVASAAAVGAGHVLLLPGTSPGSGSACSSAVSPLGAPASCWHPSSARGAVPRVPLLSVARRGARIERMLRDRGRRHPGSTSSRAPRRSTDAASKPGGGASVTYALICLPFLAVAACSPRGRAEPATPAAAPALDRDRPRRACCCSCSPAVFDSVMIAAGLFAYTDGTRLGPAVGLAHRGLRLSDRRGAARAGGVDARARARRRGGRNGED